MPSRIKGTGEIRQAVRDHLRRTAAAYGVLVVALLLTVLAALYVKQNVEARENARFDETTSGVQRALDRRMDTYVDAMLEGRGLFAASNSVTREEWSRYVAASDLQRRYPGIRAMGYAPRVTLEGRDKHVSRLRGEGFPDYELRPAGERYEYFPITYVEPFEGANRALFGRDLYAERVSRAAMEQARDTGLPRASGKIDLPSKKGSGGGPGFVVYTPVYKNGAPHDNPDARRQSLQGYIVGVFGADELLAGIFGDQTSPGVDLEVFDGAELTSSGLLHDDDGALHAADSSYSPPFEDTTTMEVAGRIWTLYFSSLPGFESGWRTNLPLFVLLSGGAISLMLFGVTWMLSVNRAAAERVGRDLESANRELEATNQELTSANRELAATNAELQAFSYSVSHDLRTPLRSIEGFSQIILEDYADRLDEEGRGHLERVKAASRHMSHLIDDLLDLSRVTRKPLFRETVDLSALAREIAAELQAADPDRRVKLAVEDGLRAEGDTRLLRVALENLLGNAWKFTAGEDVAQVEFGSEPGSDGEEPVYYVRDNGAGFDMAYAGKLFGAFQRLHPADEFEGNGIGLATVQRVIRRHGGRVWAEGKPGVGATFYFTLPK
ncbi:MAG TPA: CHASE domain-containing protein [Rubrobacteraceae bacterium]|nr:CHASE domain-containing protein [Rubrobacteraceae bacterium]